ncbi:hypothetical protein EV696_10871 [Permianibacter aggregans]|uniref:Uncharacterized protein n=2 Tax=Permianibacter aggregans TaxID=1510150 RepID=A0A4R6UME9_9GAMM|nr:hypothetical protein EV696_10871 [Permianibacter aggregans]
MIMSITPAGEASRHLEPKGNAKVDCESETSLYDAFLRVENCEFSFTKDGAEISLLWIPGVVFPKD